MRKCIEGFVVPGTAAVVKLDGKHQIGAGGGRCLPEVMSTVHREHTAHPLVKLFELAYGLV